MCRSRLKIFLLYFAPQFSVYTKFGIDPDQGYAEINSPKAVLKQAFSDGFLDHEEGWLHLLDARNQTSHIYDEATATTVFESIRTTYSPLIKDLIQKLADQ